MKKVFLGLIVSLAALTVSCGKSDVKEALRQMEQVVVKAEQEKDHLSKEEWQDLSQQFESLDKRINEAKKVSPVDQVTWVALSARWSAAAGPSLLQDALERVEEELDSAKSVSGGVDELIDAIKEAIGTDDAEKEKK